MKSLLSLSVIIFATQAPADNRCSQAESILCDVKSSCYESIDVCYAGSFSYVLKENVICIWPQGQTFEYARDITKISTHGDNQDCAEFRLRWLSNTKSCR